jgi:hypothetical protein
MLPRRFEMGVVQPPVIKYEIKGRREVEVTVPVEEERQMAKPVGKNTAMVAVDIEWTRVDGKPFEDSHHVPVREHKREKIVRGNGDTDTVLTPVHSKRVEKSGTRLVIKDQLIVDPGISDEEIELTLKKRIPMLLERWTEDGLIEAAA